MYVPVPFAQLSERDDGQIGQNTARLLNMYPERSESGATLRSASGLVLKEKIGVGRCWAALSNTAGIYSNVGGSLVLWDGTTAKTLGTLNNADTTMATNGTQVAIVAGGEAFVWDGTTLTKVTGAAFTDFQSVAFLSSFFIFTQLNGQAYTYGTNPSTLDPLDFASAEYRGDNLRRVMASQSLAWMMGEDTIEPWQLTGAADLPFQRLSATVVEKGLRSTQEAVFLDNTLFFISDEDRPYRINSFTPQMIGTDAACAAMEGRTGYALAYQKRRHDFFVSRLSDRPAFVFDPSTQAWWERSTNPSHDAWEVTATVQHEGAWYALTQNGELCTFGGHQDIGKEMRREAISTNLTQSGDRFTVNSIDLRVEGAGTIMVSYSSDAGRTFSNERTQTFGASYEQRLQFHGLGQHRQFCIKVAFTDNGDFSLHEAGVNIS